MCGVYFVGAICIREGLGAGDGTVCEIECACVIEPDKEIGKLQIAVNDEVAVGIADSLPDSQKEEAADSQLEAPFAAIDVDRLTVDRFEDEEWAAIGCCSSVEEAGDVGMVEIV